MLERIGESDFVYELDWENIVEIAGVRVRLVARLSQRKFYFILGNDDPIPLQALLGQLFGGGGQKLPKLPAPWDALLTRGLCLEVTASPSEGTVQGSLYYAKDGSKCSASERDPVEIAFFGVTILKVHGVAVSIGGEKGFDFLADIEILGQDRELVGFPPPTPPPELPPLIKLNYLGLGQRLAVPGTTGEPSIPDVVRLLKEDLSPGSPEKFAEKFNTYYAPGGGWLAAVDVEIRNFLALQAVFNDPVLYGLAVTFSEKMQLKGLKFQILYQKISDDVGMFYVDLTLPDIVRQFDVGPVSITLPAVSIAVYTNGDFKVSVGWPLGDRSITVQVFPFIGSAGFYFGKLSSATAPDVPPGINPLLVFGIALKLGVGKAFNKGILKAEISVSLHGIFEGRLGWTEAALAALEAGVPRALPPSALARVETEELTQIAAFRAPSYYWFRGTFGITAVVQGVVDFSIIKASVTIQLAADVTVTFEVGKPIPITLSASVSVALVVEIGGFKIFGKRIAIKIELKFKTEITQTFTIEPGSSRGVLRELLEPVEPLRWLGPVPPAALAAEEETTVRLYFTPQLTKAGDRTAFIAGLTIPMSDFEVLARKVAEFTVALHFGVAGVPDELRSAELRRLYRRLRSSRWLNDRAAPDPFTYDSIQKNLERLGVVLEVQATPLEGEPGQEEEAAAFPMVPALTLSVEGSAVPIDPIHFGAKSPRSRKFLEQLKAYMDELLLAYAAPDEAQAAFAEPGDVSMATFVFEDYFAQLHMEVVDQLADAAELAEASGRSLARNELADSIDYGQLAGKLSRFLQNGLRLPEVSELPPQKDWPGLELAPLVELTGQQVVVALVAEKAWVAALQGPGVLLPWLRISGEVPPQLVVPADDQEARTKLEDIGRLALGSGVISGPARLPLVTESPLRIAMKQATAWNPTRGTPEVEVQLVSSTGPLAARTAGGAVELAKFGVLAEDGSVTPLPYQAGMRIDLEVQRVVRPRHTSVSQDGSADQYVPHVYQLGGVNEANRKLLEALLHAASGDPSVLESIESIDLLYPEPGAEHGLRSRPTSDSVFVIKTNLSTDSNPDLLRGMLARLAGDEDADPVYAKLHAPETRQSLFLLLLQCGIVNSAGFYLRYETRDGDDLPEALFAESSAAPLSVVVVWKASVVQLLPFNNVLVTETPPAVEEQGTGPTYEAVVQGAKQYAPACPAGTVGFDMVRKNPQDAYEMPQSLGRPPRAGRGLTRADVIAAALAREPRPTPEELTRLMDEAGEIPVEIAKLFNLIHWRILEGNGFLRSTASMPLGPGKADGQALAHGRPPAPVPELGETDDWSYRHTFAYYRFADKNQGTDEPNRYGGIGKPLTVKFGIADNYGNELDPTDPVPFLEIEKLLYYDPLVPVHDWPAVASHYQVLPSTSAIVPGSPCLEASFAFDTSAYPQAGTPDAEPVRVALAKLALVADQLGDPNVEAWASTSLVGDMELAVSCADLQGFVTAIRTYLLTREVTPGLKLELRWDLDAGMLARQPLDLFQLDCALHLRRLDYVDPHAAAVMPEVASVRTDLAPLVEQAPAAGAAQPAEDPDLRLQSLGPFAEQLQAAFSGTLRVAVGSPNASQKVELASDALGLGQVWAVRVDDPRGITLRIDEDVRHYYAPVPLSRALQSGRFEVRRYRAEWNGGTDDFELVERTFSDFDLDASAYRFLQAIDAFLAPELSAAVAAVDPGAFETLMSNKEEIAGLVRKGVRVILADDHPEDAAVAKAADVFYQRLLVTLASAYAVSAIVQLPVQVSREQGQPPAKLYGDVEAANPEAAAEDEPGKQDSFSTARLDLEEGAGYLTFLFTAAEPTRQRSFGATLDYEVSHLEHDFAPAAAGDSTADRRYVTSSWLKFVLPFGPGEQPLGLGGFDIPIPLRFFPSPPNPEFQEARGSAPDSSVRASPIVEATRWAYSFAYSRPDVAQDSVTAKVTFNAPAPDAAPHAVAMRLYAEDEERPLPKSLFEALARFAAESDAVASHFDAIRRAAAGEGDEAVAKAAIRRFGELVTGLVAGWRLHPVPVHAKAVDRRVVNTYEIEEQDAGAKLLLRGKQQTTWDPGWPEWPTIEGYTLESSTDREAHYARDPSTPEEPGRVQRQLTLPDQSALARENALAVLRVTRNARLGGGHGGEERLVNKDFVFETPWVGFAAPATPTAVIVEELWLDDLPGDTLGGKMSALFQELFHVDPKALDERTQLLKLTVSFRRLAVKLAAGDGRLFMKLPMTLTDDYGFQVAVDWNPAVPDSYVNELTRSLAGLAKESGLPSKDSVLGFDLSLFASLTERRQLLVRLQNLRLTVGEGQNWWS